MMPAGAEDSTPVCVLPEEFLKPLFRRSPEAIAIYKGEPYVVAADV
jgi:hypothetical protein